jgi:signal transduction histidine kinase
MPLPDDPRYEPTRRLYELVVRLRAVLTPLIGAIIAWITIQDPAPWRWGALGLTVASAFALVFGSLLVQRARGLPLRSMPVNILLGMFIPPVVIVCTGGLRSPFVFMLALFPLVTGIVTPRARFGVAAAGILVVWALALGATYGWWSSLTPQLFSGPGGEARWSIVLAAMFTVVIVAVVTMGALLRETHEASVRRALDARNDLLAELASQTRLLTALSAEIAHELKNPLASLKGLCAVASRDATGRAAERLAVMRGEIDAMQAILESFLNFSRPLGPLSRESVDLVELARDVAVLHEEVCARDGVTLTVSAPHAVRAACDARKVRQVLVNLVQNALAFSPRGEAVELVVSSRAESGGRVEVRDRGPGIAPEVAERLFEPGVTSRPTGNGLGLVIARALARQHGGDVTLGEREGGGCVAVVELPARPSLGEGTLG